MTTWDENLHPRAAAGQFAEKAGSAPETSLHDAHQPSLPDRIAVGGAVLDTSNLAALPEWPDILPAPSCDVEWDEYGAATLNVRSGENSFWVSQSSEYLDSYESSLDDEVSPWSSEETVAARHWGEAALLRASQLSGQYRQHAFESPDVAWAISRAATGEGFTAEDAEMVSAKAHALQAAKDAGLEGIMGPLLDVLVDRESVSAHRLYQLTPGQITDLYDGIVGRAIDQVEIRLQED